MAYLDEIGLDVLWTNAKQWFGRKLKTSQSDTSVTVTMVTEVDTDLGSAEIPPATGSLAGVMTGADKSKLDGIEDNATANIGTITGITTASPLLGGGLEGSVNISHAQSGVVPATYGKVAPTQLNPGFGELIDVPGIQVDVTGHLVDAGSHKVKIPETRVSTTVPGLMSPQDKVKLNGIEAEATKNFAGEGIDIVFGEIINTGVREARTGSHNGAIRFNTNGEWADVDVAGLQSAAYTPVSDYATAAQGVKADNAILSAEKGVANGVATLDSSGLVPASQLPSYVDDVLEFASKSAFPSNGETGKIYVSKDTNLTYRFTGTSYIEISQSLALGETSSTAYPGNKGKQLADTIATYGNVVTHNVTTTVDTTSNIPTANAVKQHVKTEIDSRDYLTTIEANSPIAKTASGRTVTLYHETSGADEGGYGDELDQTPDFGESFSVNFEEVDEFGHIVNISTHDVTIPNKLADATTSGLLSAEDYSKLSTLPSSVPLYVGECATAAATAEKVVTLNDTTGYQLAVGTIIIVHFTSGNSAATPQLNVENSGPISVGYPSANGTVNCETGKGTTYNAWQAHETIIFTYNGSVWVKGYSAKSLEEAYRLALAAAPNESPNLTGVPTAPTALTGTKTEQIATTEFVRSEIDDSAMTKAEILAICGINVEPEDDGGESGGGSGSGGESGGGSDSGGGSGSGGSSDDDKDKCECKSCDCSAIPIETIEAICVY